MLPDLSLFTAQLVDPSLYFATEGVRANPLVFLHETGEPAYAAVDGKLVPYAEYVGATVVLSTPAEPLNLLTSGPAVGAFAVAVTPPAVATLPPLSPLPPIGGNA
jgi:hypothetical protein